MAVNVTDTSGDSDSQGFTITTGPPVFVPNVVGQTQAAAQASVIGAGLTVGAVTNSPSSTVPSGQVMSQLVDDDKAGRKMDGLIGIQLHKTTGPMKIETRNIRIKEM